MTDFHKLGQMLSQKPTDAMIQASLLVLGAALIHSAIEQAQAEELDPEPDYRPRRRRVEEDTWRPSSISFDWERDDRRRRRFR